MSRTRKALTSLVVIGLWIAAQDIWAQAKPVEGGTFTADFEAASLAQWSVEVADERSA